MRITEIRTTRLAVPLARVFRGGTYEITTRCTIITEVLTDTGISGCTYAGDERTRQQEIVHIIDARLKPLLIGQDPLDIERLWDTCLKRRFLMASGPPFWKPLRRLTSPCGMSKARLLACRCTNCLGAITTDCQPS
jgi:L-alanine-DL-glutamate epimerase-like enolase superfamily enzyme